MKQFLEETDIFLEKERLVIEIAHKQIPEKIESRAKRFIPKSKVHDIPEGIEITPEMHMKRMLDYLEEKDFQDVYPNIVCFCPDISAGNCDDLEKLIESCKVTEKVSSLAIWKRQKIQCFFENSCRKKLKLESDQLKNFFNSNF